MKGNMEEWAGVRGKTINGAAPRHWQGSYHSTAKGVRGKKSYHQSQGTVEEGPPNELLESGGMPL